MKLKKRAPFLKRPPNRRGQAVLEYILLMAVVFIASTVMISFLRNGLFATGLEELPNKMGGCLSQKSTATFGGNQCQ